MSNHIGAILWKQIKDTIKNKTILIQFLMFPLITVVMENAVSIPGMPEHFFTNLFSVMYVGMAPLTSAAAIISEEREKNTLRVMQMFNVKAAALLIGNAIYIISLCMLGSLVIGAAGGYRGRELLVFMLLMLLGHGCSFLLGAAIGALCRSQMAATSVTVPVMMVLSFLPMLSLFNETIRKLSKYLYSEQLYLMVNTVSELRLTAENGIIMACNILLITGAFLAVYWKIKQDG
ncbi:MAG: ABC transporter permease [Lachnospiraceae bacterium]|nr:ABC transporter permease [Lachnospiraceae bacterium]